MGDLTPAPLSPCTGICTLDDDDRCIGCARTLDEIATWGSMTAAEQLALIAALPIRLAQLDMGAGINPSSGAAARR